MRHEHLLAPCPAPIVPDTGRDVAQQVTTAHVDLRHDLLQCQRLTLETTLDLLPRLGVIVVDASIGDVTDAATATVQPLGQFHVLQARHGFVETIAVPCLARSEEHTSELQSLMRISYAVFCLKKKNISRND